MSAPLKTIWRLLRVYAKTAEPIEMPFGRLTYVDPRKHILDGDQGRTNPFVFARG